MILLGDCTWASGWFRTADYACGIWRLEDANVVSPHGILVSSISGVFRRSESTLYRTSSSLIEIERERDVGVIRENGTEVGTLVMRRQFLSWYDGNATLTISGTQIRTSMPLIYSKSRRYTAKLVWGEFDFDIGITRSPCQRNGERMTARSHETVDRVLSGPSGKLTLERYERCQGPLNVFFGFEDARKSLFGIPPCRDELQVYPDSLKPLADAIGSPILEAICLWLNAWVYTYH